MVYFHRQKTGYNIQNQSNDIFYSHYYFLFSTFCSPRDWLEFCCVPAAACLPVGGLFCGSGRSCVNDLRKSSFKMSMFFSLFILTSLERIIQQNYMESSIDVIEKIFCAGGDLNIPNHFQSVREASLRIRVIVYFVDTFLTKRRDKKNIVPPFFYCINLNSYFFSIAAIFSLSSAIIFCCS